MAQIKTFAGFPAPTGANSSDQPSREQQVFAALDQLYPDPSLTAEVVGLQVGVSGRRVKAILAAAGTTLRAELLDRRMDRARKLLEGENFAIRYVAMLCGYRCASTFAKRFAEQHHGLTPRAYRVAKGGSARTGGATGAFRKPAERARARENGEAPPSMSPWRLLPGFAEVIGAEEENERHRAVLRGERSYDIPDFPGEEDFGYLLEIEGLEGPGAR